MSKNFTTLLYVVGQRPDNSFVVEEINGVPDGDGIDTAAEWCRAHGLKYVACARARSITAGLAARS